MPTPVKLYVYDLSNGYARQLSLKLTGRQIDGIWHTSVVVFGKEIFYGQGISITRPGKSHHGSPLQIVDMGETAIDEETFNDYVDAMREHYTADKYHLLDFNCNSFTNDCIGFLTGGGIPSHITSLPSDFFSTSFGAALRPRIDAMFSGRPANTVAARPPMPSASPDPALAASLLQSVTTRAQDTTGNRSLGGASGTHHAPASAVAAPAPGHTSAQIPPSQTTAQPNALLTVPVHVTTNPASFQSLLRSHRAVVAFFTSATCGPCRMIEPVFEDLAKSKSRPSGGVGFAKIDLSVGLGGAVASAYQVRATPTFIFFLDGKKTHELRGVDAPELRTQVDMLVYEAFPPHAHVSLSLPAIEAISLNPILFTQIPNLDAMISKLVGFIDSVSSWTGAVTQVQVKEALSKTVLPFLKASTVTSSAQQFKPTSVDLWPALTSSLVANLGASELFPLADIWRIALLNTSFATWNATKRATEGPLQRLMDKALQVEEVPRNYLLTILRMLANVFSNRMLTKEVILFARISMTRLLVEALLHADATVRTAAASLGFNVAAYLQRLRVDKVKAGDDRASVEENEEWELEILVAVLRAIEQERNEETVHRLVACLGLLLRLSPYAEQEKALLEALRTGEMLKRKVAGGSVKKEVRRLMVEVAEQLCPRM